MEQLRQPLLGRWRGDGFEEKKDAKNCPQAAVDLRFATRLWRLLRVAKCGDCGWLILLSILSVAITSQAGLVVGHFYNSLISKNLELFVVTIGQCLFWYGGESICNATQLWTAEYLAIGWRLNLTQAAHSAYCSRLSLSALSQGNSLDNPDERLTNEVRSFCQTLAKLMMKTIASPLMILYYTWWVWYHVGWIGPVLIYTFFFCGVIVTRMIISPIAGLVASQEKLEADFRIAHVRFHANAEEIGMYDSVECERAELEKDLKAALANRKTLVSRHFVLKLSNKAYDYLGGIFTYCVIAIPVFGGLFDTEDGGELANLISNASFAVLQLIYGFSELMDSANLVSNIAGHCARVGELLEYLDVLNQNEEASGEVCFGLKPKHNDGHPVVLSIQSSNISTPRTTVPEQGHGAEVNLICPSTSFQMKNGEKLKLSICFSPPSVHEQLATIFPEVAPSSLLMVSTVQCIGPSAAENLLERRQDMAWTSGIRLSQVIDLASTRTDVLGGQQEVMTEFISRLVQRLKGFGHWAGAVNIHSGAVLYPSDLLEIDDEKGSRREKASSLDPTDKSLSERGGEEARLGRSVPGPLGGREPVWSSLLPGRSLMQKRKLINTVASAAEKCLGYSDEVVGANSSTQQSRPVIKPDVVSVFTSAPAAVLRRIIIGCVQEDTALREEKYVAGEAEPAQKLDSEFQSFCPLLPALVVNNMTFFAPLSEKPVVLDLTMELQWGESLLITGPTGSGKTSFLRTLCDLWPLDAGSKRIPPRSNCRSVLILPQRPVMARAGLAGQIVYPESIFLLGNSSSHIVSQLQHALESVGMLYLLGKVHNNWEFESDWGDTLSPGEQQLLSLARVFYHRPQFVILDEATSALSEQSEDAIYCRLMELGVTVISVAHRNRLRCYHSKLLEILGDGKGGCAYSRPYKTRKDLARRYWEDTGRLAHTMLTARQIEVWQLIYFLRNRRVLFTKQEGTRVQNRRVCECIGDEHFLPNGPLIH